MNAESARSWLIAASLIISGAVFVFFLIAPLVGYPLVWAQSRHLLQMILPIFLGYLGSASHFVFRAANAPKARRVRSASLLNMLIKGPIALFALAVVVTLSAFGLSNRTGAPIGTGMTLEDLTATMALALSFLTVSTSVLASYLFAQQDKKTGGETAGEGE